MELLSALRTAGTDARVVLPGMDDRFYVYMLGLGVPPPTNRFRWCTPKLKVQPMMAELEATRQRAGEKLLSITGVRLGESEARDQRIAVSCSKDSGECGQGWFQVTPSDAIADTLAPLLHWRVCHVFDWCFFESDRHGYPQVADIAEVYGDEDTRTGCIACNLASDDKALRRLTRTEKWGHLSPLLELKPLYAELKLAKWRLRKAEPEVNKDGRYAKNGQRMGPLTMEGRAYGLARVLDIQERAQVDLINAEEEARIRQLWAENAWPQGWSGDEINAAEMIDQITVVGNELITQPLLVRSEP
jgi:DNA sulfur modification protein DndC